MKIKTKEFPLKNGKKCILRNAVPEEAKDMIEFLKISRDETPYLLGPGDEVNFTEEEEAKILENILVAPKNTMIVAEIDGKIIGNTGITIMDDRHRRICHRGNFGITVLKDYWHIGIGTALIEAALDFANAAGYEQIELGVFSENERAYKLYERHGFIKCGEIPNASKLEDGRYLSEVMMFRKI